MRPRQWRVLTRWVIPRSLEGIGVSIPLLNLPRSWRGRRGAEEGAPFDAPFLRASDVMTRDSGSRASEDQNESLALNWISRPGVMGMVIVPNWGVLTKRFGVPRFVLFRELNASARNWKLAFSVIRKARERARSSV